MGPTDKKVEPRVLVMCGTVADLTPEQQARAAAEVAQLPPNSILYGVLIPDLMRMRDEARACASQQRKGR